MSDEKDIPIENHEYDGIQEYDNPLPMWWLGTFYGTIIFAALYYMHYTVGGGPTQADYLKEEMAATQSAQVQTQKQAAPETEEVFAKLLASQDALKVGKQVYADKCATCHGPQLQGLIGPNLTDDYWIHGKGTALDVAAVVRQGVLEKGMPPWQGQIKDDEIRAVVAYVLSQHGSNPPNAKPPQGEKIVSK